jgi:DNA-binding XRE family transcriptional regulator
MRSAANDILPPKVRRSLAKLGGDISIARRKRSLTTAMMAERLGVAKSTYLKIEKGDPSVAIASYAMALFVLGFDDALGKMIDPAGDAQGMLLDEARLPKRVRVKRAKP